MNAQPLSLRSIRRKAAKKKRLLEWQLTPWQMNGEGGWKVQPIIVVEGRVPFFADHPSDYIARLEELHDDPALTPGTVWTFIGQLKDGLEQAWGEKG